MLVKDVVNIIESVAPLYLQADFDNSGLIAGDECNTVNKVLVTLDVTYEAVSEAIRSGADMIVSHHPLIFSPIKRITAEDVTGRILLHATRNNIAIYASHTPFDNCKGGITDSIVSNFDAIESVSLEEDGTGRLVTIRPMRLKDIVTVIKDVTGDNTLRVQGNGERLISKFGIINGAGGRDESLSNTLKDNDAELFITGETKHSFALMLKEMDIALIDVEHYHAEKIFVDKMSSVLRNATVSVIEYKESNPYNI